MLKNLPPITKLLQYKIHNCNDCRWIAQGLSDMASSLVGVNRTSSTYHPHNTLILISINIIALIQFYKDRKTNFALTEIRKNMENNFITN